MIDLHLFALNCNESFRIVVDEKEKRAKLCCLTLSILVFYVKCFIINLLGPQTRTLTGLSYTPLFCLTGAKVRIYGEFAKFSGAFLLKKNVF